MQNTFLLYEAMAIVCGHKEPDLIQSEQMRKLLADLKAGHTCHIDGLSMAQRDTWQLYQTQRKAGIQHAMQGLQKVRQRAAKWRAYKDLSDKVTRLADPTDDCSDFVAASGDAEAFYTEADLSSHIIAERRKSRSFRSPWQSLQPMLSDFSPGDVLVIAGYSGSGKTNFAMQMTYFNGYKTLYFGVDMTPRAFGERLWRTGWYRDNHTRKMDNERQQCEAAFHSAITNGTLKIEKGIAVFRGSSMTLGQIETLARERMAAEQYDVIVIDYAGRIDSDAGSREHWRAEQEVARAIKGMAIRLQVRIIALAQLNSSNEQGKKPQASWLSGSKELIAASDGVICLWHDWGTDASGAVTKDSTHINVSDDIKARNTGSNGNARLECFGLWMHEDAL